MSAQQDLKEVNNKMEETWEGELLNSKSVRFCPYH